MRGSCLLCRRLLAELRRRTGRPIRSPVDQERPVTSPSNAGRSGQRVVEAEPADSRIAYPGTVFIPFAAADVFSSSHIALTALICGVAAAFLSYFALGRGSAILDCAAIGILTAVSVFLWRRSANMPQLNSDGLREFSANDWLAPVVAFVVLSVYAAMRRDGEDPAFARAKAFAVIAVLVVNVVAI
jgi:hypothetical protein